MSSSVRASAVNCVKGEIHNVLSVLRLNARWATRARFTHEIPAHSESPLIRNLKSLHTYLEAVDDLGDVDAVQYLEPFLAVVESPMTTGPMTGAALSSLHKILLYGFMSCDSPRAREGIDRIARGISQFNFEETDPDADEVVLMKLLELSALCLRSEVGRLLSDTRCLDIFRSCHRISCLDRISSLLRNTAGNTLAHIVLILYSRTRPRGGRSGPKSPGGETLLSPNRGRSAQTHFGAEGVAVGGEKLEKPGGTVEKPLESQGQVVDSNTAQAASHEKEGVIAKEDVTSNDDWGGSGSEPSSPKSRLIAGDGTAENANTSKTEGKVTGKKAKQHRSRDVSLGGAGSVNGSVIGDDVNVLVELMRILSRLSNPRENSEDNCVLSLSLINIALEAGGGQLVANPALVEVMQSDLCKNLLQSSQTEDLTILSLTLRVVFNLFNSIKEHLKVQLEVFLTSIHLRILEGAAAHPPEQRELVLESLLEFCREPTIMLDLYINYDCDVQCTNLFETVCTSLARQALPSAAPPGELNTLNLLALEGVLAVIESMARRCSIPSAMGPQLSLTLQGPPVHARNHVPSLSPPPPMILANRGESGQYGSESDSDADWTQRVWMEQARARTAEVLHQRKRMKTRLSLATARFNTDIKGWLSYAQELELLPNPATGAAVARFLKTTMGIDKATLGEYMSKGPVDKYPFNAEVLEEYTHLFDFKDMTFDNALRAFLKEFRLPGEAQCIDRLMEAFAKEYYRQAEGHHPFVETDAAFILAFSIIMLNTDLHNPQIREDKRMKKSDFVRNNRKINGGADLPLPFLESIYDSISTNEIQVQRDITSVQDGMGIDYNLHWDGILNRRVMAASFTPTTTRNMTFSAGVHEREMFASMAEAALGAMRAVYERTRDDLAVVKVLHGFFSYAKIAVYFQLFDVFNSTVDLLFMYGESYMLEAAEGVRSPPFPALIALPGLPDTQDVDTVAPLADGACRHRGLLALKIALELVRVHCAVMAEAWAPFTECLLGLCDLRALPSTLSDVDDFSDAAGAPLPPSEFAKRCRHRAAGHGRSSEGGRGFFGGLTGFLWGGGDVDHEDAQSVAKEAAAAALEQVVVTCQLVQLFPQTKDLPLQSVLHMLRALLSRRDPAPPPNSNSSPITLPPTFEAHAVLALELAARVVLANRHRCEELWPLLHAHVERALGDGSITDDSLQSSGELYLPFLVERMIVTVLRSCIHMLDRPKAAPKLLATLALLQRLPPAMMEALGERVAMGLLALVQANAAYLDQPHHWTVIATLLNMSAAVPRGRQAAWETVAHMTERGPINSLNCRPLFQLLVRFLEGELGVAERTQKRQRDRSFTPQALEALATFVLSLAGKPGPESGDPSSPPPRITIPSGLNQGQLDSLWETSLRMAVPLVAHLDPSVGRSAAAAVQRLLLQTSIEAPAAWHAVFMDVLLKLPVGKRPPKSDVDDAASNGNVELAPGPSIPVPDEVRLRCCTVVTRGLLMNLPLLTTLPCFNTIWLNLIALMGTNLADAPPGSVVYDMCQQMVTNMLMVAAHQGVFELWSPASGRPRDLLSDTWLLLDPVCPTIRPLLYPTAPPPAPTEERGTGTEDLENVLPGTENANETAGGTGNEGAPGTENAVLETENKVPGTEFSAESSAEVSGGDAPAIVANDVEVHSSADIHVDKGEEGASKENISVQKGTMTI